MSSNILKYFGFGSLLCLALWTGEAAALPSLSISDATVVEGNGRRGGVARMRVTLSEASTSRVMVGFATSNGSATGGSDFNPTKGRLVFLPGETTAEIPILILGDRTDEANETFTISLLRPVGATIADNQATVTITDDDPEPTVSFTGSTTRSVPEGQATVLTLQLSEVSGLDVSVPLTGSGTATSGTDYTMTPNPVVIPTGQLSATVRIATVSDYLVDGTETANIAIGNPTYADTGSVTNAVITINDNGLYALHASGDGTVVDLRSNLIWLQKADCFGEQNWNDAMASAAALASGQCGLSDGSIAGNWRLPTIDEWRAFIDTSQRPALLAGHPFSGVSVWYWSSSTYLSFTGYVWGVFLYDGAVGSNGKTYTGRVWPVRGGL